MHDRNPYLAIALFLCLLALAGCGRNQVEGAQGPPAMPVKVQTATLQKVGDYTEYIATLRSRHASVLKPEVEGQVTRIFVTAGQRVSAGQALLAIDPRKQEATVHSQQAGSRAREAAVAYTRNELERKKNLYSAGVVSKQELDLAQASYDAARAEMDAMQADVRQQQVQLHYYTVKAPEAGMVGDIPVRVGDRVTSSTILTTLDTGGELEAYISIPAEKSGDVKVGTPIELLDEEGKPAARTTAGFVSPRVDPETQLLLLKATVPNADRRLRNEQVVHARVIFHEQERPTIPIIAVSRLAGQTFAYVAATENGKTVAKQRSVKLGEVVGNDYVVLDGISAGEKVIVSGVQMLADGVPVAPGS
jgi:RND family efflux transporter MFP subunit